MYGMFDDACIVVVFFFIFSMCFTGGVCGEYNVDAMSVRGTSHLCRNFTPSCPDRYKSTHQFRCKHLHNYIFFKTS